MKAIINGLRYDTEKAILIGETDTGGSVTDFGYWSAGLYRTPRSGRYFLAGEGGPMTGFSRYSGPNTWTGGSKIIPMTTKGAREWAEQYLTTEEVEAGFADVLQEA